MMAFFHLILASFVYLLDLSNIIFMHCFFYFLHSWYRCFSVHLYELFGIYFIRNEWNNFCIFRTYNQPDEEESEFPITHVLRDGYLTPRQGDSGQTSNLHRGGLLSDEGYRSQESDMDYFAQQQASREFPRVENFNSNPDFTREYFVPLSSSGYSNRVAVSTTH